MIHCQDSPVRNFYENRSVFITGATGFLGKVLLEKLLRSCSGIKNIYILIREKRGKSPRQRMEEIISSRVFDLLKKEYPHALKKIIGVTGDISLPGLGISESDIRVMSETVSVVFHAAATVKFDEPLKGAIDFNVLGTRKVVELCHKLPKIEALVHVSTAYSHCDRKEIDEMLYTLPMSPQDTVEMTRWMDPELLKTIVPKIVGGRRNTYTFSKALAENLLLDECGSIPVAIVRPSMVTGAWKEPYAGWIDTFNGPAGLSVATASGILRTVVIHEEATADIIPVDVVINLMISVGWYVATHRPNRIMVYNCTSSNTNKVTWGEMHRNGLPYILKYPTAVTFRYPEITLRRSQLCNNVHAAFAHYIPAFFIDLMAYLFFIKPGMVKLYQKIHKMLDVLMYFMTHEWKFNCNNISVLNDLLSEEEKKIFFLDITSLNYECYFKDLALGGRKFLLKEDPSTLPAARENLRKHYILSRISDVVLAVGLWKIFFSKFLSLDNLYDIFCNIAHKFNEMI